MAASELLLTNGATPVTPGAGKTKLFISTAKQLTQIDDAGVVTIINGLDTIIQGGNPNPAGTASTTGVMMGMSTGASFTPIWTGRCLVTFYGDVNNNTAGDGAKFQIRFGTPFGSAPANGAALTGTAVGSTINMSVGPAGGRYPFSINAIVTGLTIGTSVWFDLSLAAVVGGTATIQGANFSAVEI